MAKFELHINTGGAASADSPGDEVARLLRKAADHFAGTTAGDQGLLRLLDINGNRVGFAVLKEE